MRVIRHRGVAQGSQLSGVAQSLPALPAPSGLHRPLLDSPVWPGLEY